MTSSGTFTCPACGADFEVQERLGGAQEPVAPAHEEPVVADRPHEEAVSFQCPACGADYETTERLGEASVERSERRGVPLGSHERPLTPHRQCLRR